MKNYLLLTALLMGLLLSGCGFHTPQKPKTTINANIIAAEGHAFARLLKRVIGANPKASSTTLEIKLAPEQQETSIGSYSKGVVSGYYLVINVPVKVYRNQKLVLEIVLTNSAYLSDTGSDLSDRLQQNSRYQSLRESLVRQLLARLSNL